jgi:hypothetical protein
MEYERVMVFIIGYPHRFRGIPFEKVIRLFYRSKECEKDSVEPVNSAFHGDLMGCCGFYQFLMGQARPGQGQRAKGSKVLVYEYKRCVVSGLVSLISAAAITVLSGVLVFIRYQLAAPRGISG